MIPVLETERLRLRQWREADFEPFAALYADETEARWIGGACNRQDAWRRMAAMAGHWTLRGYGFWALESKATGEFVGWAGLFNPEGWPEPEIGWTLLPGARGQGFATEAVLRSRAYAYETLGWKTAISLIRLPNEASIAVAERVGAHLERATIFREAEIGIYRHPNNVGDPTLKPQLH